MTFKELLQKANMTGYELDKKTRIGISPAYMLISGQKNPLTMRLDTTKKIADALAVTLDEYYHLLSDQIKK